MNDKHDTPLDETVIGALRELEADGAAGLLDELVELFVADTPPRLEALASAVGAGDLGAVESTAHSLKSSCGNLGATGLADLFREIERLGREQQAEELPSLVARSNEEYRRVEQALRDLS